MLLLLVWSIIMCFTHTHYYRRTQLLVREKKSTSAERIFPINIEEERLWSFALLPFLLYGTVFEIGLSFRPSSSLFFTPFHSAHVVVQVVVVFSSAVHFFTLIFCPILVLLAF